MIKTFYFNELRTGCYVLYDDTRACAIVDPGCVSDSEKHRLVKFIEDNGLQPQMLINTHGHFDHVMGNAFVTGKWKIPTYMSVKDLPDIRRARDFGKYFEYSFEQPSEEVIDITDGMEIRFGHTVLKCYHTPGHTPGGVVLYNEAEHYLLTGDSLFRGSIGRTDLPGGDYDALVKSLKEVILRFPPDCAVYPGHGPETTLLAELGGNPFLQF